jgi:hypothetical protein
MEMQMITLTQHLPNWCDGFEPEKWHFNSLEELEKMPFVKRLIKESKSEGYLEHKLYFDDDDNTICVSFLYSTLGADPYDMIIGTVDNIEEVKKIFRNDQVHV